MRITTLRHLAVGVTMLVGAGLAMAMIPREKVASEGPRIDLERMVPASFGEWKLDSNLTPIQPDPGTQDLLGKLYSQTLTRTYRNPQGERIMLSIAYGGAQTNALQVHRPEVCYHSQGFKIMKEFDDRLDTGVGVIPVRRLVTANGPRIEPVTYWMTIGEKIAFGRTLAWKLTQIKYGLTGKIPDGILFRVSSIDSDETRAFAAQNAFVHDLLHNEPEAARIRLIGQVTL
jgi:EpsI family protein